MYHHVPVKVHFRSSYCVSSSYYLQLVFGSVLSAILHVFTDKEALRHARMTCRFEVYPLSLTSSAILLMATAFRQQRNTAHPTCPRSLGDAVAPTWPHLCSGQVSRITDKRRIQRYSNPVARSVGMSRFLVGCVFFFKLNGPGDFRCIFVCCVARARYIDGERQIFLVATRWNSNVAQQHKHLISGRTGFRKINKRPCCSMEL